MLEADLLFFRSTRTQDIRIWLYKNNWIRRIAGLKRLEGRRIKSKRINKLELLCFKCGKLKGGDSWSE